MWDLPDFQVCDFSPNTTRLQTQYITIDGSLYSQHEPIYFVQEESEVQGEVNLRVTLMELAVTGQVRA